jgi:SAM-dependent methyltransferase
MRDEKVAKVPACYVERFFDRLGFGRINGGTRPRDRIMKQGPYVIGTTSKLAPGCLRKINSFHPSLLIALAIVLALKTGNTHNYNMSYDILDMRKFYASSLGNVTHRLLSDAIEKIWPSADRLRVLGLGYAVPYLPLWHKRAERVLAFMPARMGVEHWPHSSTNSTSTHNTSTNRALTSLSALVEPSELPLPDASIDRVVIVHALETSDAPHDLLSEVSRILAPGGRLLLIVPNRAGLWARFDTTPFGEGRPYSQGQLMALLRECSLTPHTWAEALFMPPFERRLILRSSLVWEKMGRYVPWLAGVHLIDASKQLYRPVRVRPVRTPFRLPPLLAPAPAHSTASDQVKTTTYRVESFLPKS